MRIQNIDKGWIFRHGACVGYPNPDRENESDEINLPHDYMVESNVSANNGRATAIIRSGYTQGSCKLSVSAQGFETATVTLAIE